MTSILQAESLNLEQYLSLSSKNVFKIPYTQRPYEWTRSQVERLFNDIIALYENEDAEHVLNFITVFTEDGYQNIYDGQQRTVTILIILCNIIHKMESMGARKKAAQLKAEFLMREDWRDEGKKSLKLEFDQESTNEFFINYIVEGKTGLDIEITDSEKKLRDNYDLIRQLLNRYMEEREMDIDDLNDFLISMMDRMHVILLKTESEEVANQMFETLNNTGKKLSNFYVVKNKCVKILGEKETSKYWDEIEINLDGLNKNNFLVQYVSIFNGKTTNVTALRVLEEESLKNKETTRETLEQLLEVSKYYLDAEKPTRIINPSANEEISRYRELLMTLKKFKASQYRPLLFSMLYKGYETSEVNEGLERILDLQIRNFFISQHKGNTVERMYPSLAKKVYTNDKDRSILDHIEKILEDKKVNDLEIESILKHRIFNKRGDAKLLRYLLKRIYDRENKHEVKINEDSGHVNLEHILPENPKDKSDWTDIFTDEEREKYTYLLGNLTLILGRKNSSLGNRDFSYKRKKLKESEIIQNKKIAENEDWTQVEINKRTQDLTDLLLEII